MSLHKNESACAKTLKKCSSVQLYPKNIHIVLILWGEEYWKNFLEITLPSRLTPHNFKEFSRHFNVIFKIFTTQQDFEKYANSRELVNLKAVTDVDFLPIISTVNTPKYSLFSEIHKIAIKEAMKTQAGLIFDCPDHFYSNALFGNLVPLIKSGKKLLLVPGIRLCLEDFITDSTISEKVLNKNEFENKNLMEGALRNLHPYGAQRFFIKNKFVSSWSYQIFWSLNKNNFIQIGFHFHPFFIWPEKDIDLDFQTIDYGEFLYRACPNKKTHSYCGKDQFTYFELSSKNLGRELSEKKASIFSYLYWAKLYAHPRQIAYFYKKKIYSDSPVKQLLAKKIQINSFVFLFYILNIIPIFLIKPFLFKAHKNSLNKEMGLIFFLRKIRILNYYEALLTNNYTSYDFDALLNFVQIHFKKIRYEFLKRIIVHKFETISCNLYSIYIQKIMQIVRFDTCFFGNLLHESVKRRNKDLTKALLKTTYFQNIESKYLIYLLKELAIQNYLDLFDQIWIKSEIKYKKQIYILKYCLPHLVKNKATTSLYLICSKLPKKKIRSHFTLRLIIELTKLNDPFFLKKILTLLIENKQISSMTLKRSLKKLKLKLSSFVDIL